MVHTFTLAYKIRNIFKHIMFSYNTHFAAYTIEAQVTAHLLHRHLTQCMDSLFNNGTAWSQYIHNNLQL
jgi:hypothetical protein